MNNGSLPTRGIGRLPGPLSDQVWRNLKNAETPAMEGEFPITRFLTTALLSKREMKVSSVYTWQMTLLKECNNSVNVLMSPIIHLNKPCVFQVLMSPIIHVNKPRVLH